MANVIREELDKPCSECGRTWYNLLRNDMPRYKDGHVFCSWWCFGRFFDN